MLIEQKILLENWEQIITEPFEMVDVTEKRINIIKKLLDAQKEKCAESIENLRPKAGVPEPFFSSGNQMIDIMKKRILSQ